MMDLFGPAPREALVIPAPDADVRLYANALERGDADDAFETLHKAIPWESREVVVWGKVHVQPRLVAWFGDEGTRYSYSGSSLTPLPWTPLLTRLRQEVEALTNGAFNSVLLNLYRNERDGMGWHSDDEPELGPEPAIASLSLGETRVFQMKHKCRPELATVNIALPHGSVLWMGGPTQRHWKHALRKEAHSKGPRINLTFRHIRGES